MKEKNYIWLRAIIKVMPQLLIEKAFEPARYPKNYVEDGLEKRMPNFFLDKSHPAVYMYEHRDAYASSYGLAYKNGRLLPESIYCLIKDSAKPFTFYKKILTGKVVKIEKECVLFHHAWYDNFYHWFTECYPKLVLAKEFIRDKYLIMNENMKPFHKQSLEVIDCAGIVYCKNGEVVKARKLYVLGQLSDSFGHHHPEIVKSLRSFLVYSFGIEYSSANHFGNIYTSRVRSNKRKCVNEREVLAVLKNFGFSEAVMDDMSLKEQLGLFSRTANVCGVHGSSFVNALVMPTKGLVIDMIERHHNDLCYFNFLNNVGINYLYLPSEGVGEASNFRDNDIVADLHLLEKRIEKYIAKP